MKKTKIRIIANNDVAVQEKMGINTPDYNRIFEKPFDAELFGKGDAYPRSMTKRRIILFKNKVAEMNLGNNIVSKEKSE